MSALWRELFATYAIVALLVTLGLGLLRAGLWLSERGRLPLSSRQALRAGRLTLAVAVGLPLACLALRGLVPVGPLFSFERSVVRHTARLPEPSREPVGGGRIAQAQDSTPVLPWGALAGLTVGIGVAGCLVWRLAQQRRLLRRLGSLPLARRVGRVAIAVDDSDGSAYSVWFPFRGTQPGAWVVVPASLLVQPESLRMTVLHELQHHRQRDTVFAYARVVLDSVFFWNPAMLAASRWLASLQEMACDEALVTTGKAQPGPYAECLLQASLRIPHSRPLAAGVTGMSHPTVRRIHMLFQSRPVRPFRATALVASVALVLTPLALWAQSASRGRALNLEEARALAKSSAREGDLPVVVDEQVLEKLNAFVTVPKGRDFMRKALTNLGPRRETLTRTLRQHSLPEGLVAVAMVESAVSNLPETSREPSMARGPRGAGVWMFIAETARQYGLTVDATKDERLDVERETEAAAALFTSLHARYGDWRLALAAYNQGEALVDGVLAKSGTRDASELARTGRFNDYVSTVQAGLLILRNPHLLD
ncbi:transglycosylase SLT domain-containing protein [Myxococcaceae bacterium JPH2]|nr:transglycosylase SLT domain-containing protein [Myxococcaceae bacterium JPH2]